jgi:hypothetical protein
MSRYERSYSGERRSYGLRVQLTPSEGAELEAAAALTGAPTLSLYVRELLFRRSAAVVAGTRRNPEAKALMDAMNAAGHQLQAIGNNLNQIARQLNATGELRDRDELRAALDENREAADAIKRAALRVLDL